MQAKALVCSADQTFEISDVVLAEPGATNIAVRAVCSGVSIGTEFAVITGRLNWGSYPLVTGYQAVGVVEHVGADVSGFQVGDRVYYRDNKSIALADGARVTAAAGTHCSAWRSCIAINRSISAETCSGGQYSCAVPSARDGLFGHFLYSP